MLLQAPMNRFQYLLLDRDGTLIEDRHYLSDPQAVELLPGTARALRRLAGMGLDFYLVSNQSGIGRGYFSIEDYNACAKRLDELLFQAGVGLKGSAFCPHAPEERCLCRKPAIEMWEGLRDRFGLAPSQGIMVGDKAEDVAFGKAAGLARTILVLTGHGEEHARRLGLPDLKGGAMELEPVHPEWPDAQARDLLAAADLIEGWSVVQGAGS